MKITCFSLSRTSLVLVALLLSLTANSYDIETHAKLTNEAFSQSQLSSDQLQKRLGIDGWLLQQPGAPLSVGDLSQFLDVSGDRILSRRYLGYEAELIGKIVPKEVYEKEVFKLNGWMISGVIREDDLQQFKLLTQW